MIGLHKALTSTQSNNFGIDLIADYQPVIIKRQ